MAYVSSLARRALALGCAACLLLAAVGAGADEVTVPVNLQVELLGRIVRYERTFAAEATPIALLVVSRTNAPECVRVSSQLTAELRRAGRIGGRVITVSAAAYTTPAALRAQVGSSHARLVYLGAGLGRDVPAIATALGGAGVITVAAVGADVDRGAVVGFELVSSRPRIVVNLAAARAQRLQFNAQFLRLARIVQ